MTTASLDEIERYASQLKEPADYFGGACPEGSAVPFNVVVFSRLSRQALRPRAAFRHHRFVLTINLATAGAAALEGRWRTLSPGHCLLVFPYQVHAYANLKTERACWLFVTFELADARGVEMLRDRVLPLSPASRKWLKELVLLWQQHREQAGQLAWLTGLILHELKAHSAGAGRDKPDAANRPSELSHPSIRFQNGTAPRLLPRIHAILEQQNPGSRVKALARRLNLSESHLRAEFRKQTGLSLGQYLRDLRLNRAASMLAGTSRRVGEIALLCGFDSPYTFSRAFRRALGVPPKVYRRQYGRGASRPKVS